MQYEILYRQNDSWIVITEYLKEILNMRLLYTWKYNMWQIMQRMEGTFRILVLWILYTINKKVWYHQRLDSDYSKMCIAKCRITTESSFWKVWINSQY